MRREVGALTRDQAVRFSADCAERVLPIFESAYPSDDRPRKAIEAGRARAALANKHIAATHAARAAGHAAATIHVATHAAAAAAYAARAATDAGERTWQLRRLGSSQRSVSF